MTIQSCEAYQMSDQKCCDRCGLVWDMNDPDPPNCLSDTQIINNNLMKVGKLLRDAMPTVKQAAEGLSNAFKTTSEQFKKEYECNFTTTQIEQDEINRRGMVKLRESMK